MRSQIHLFARATALSLGLFALLNLLGESIAPGFNANEWWIVFPENTDKLFNLVTVPFSLALLGFALVPQMSLWRSRVTRLLLLAFAVICTWNAAVCITLNTRGIIGATVPVPLSTFIAALLFLCAWLAKPEGEIARRPMRMRFVFCTGVSVVAFAFLQMLFFGTTDYRRRTDAIVVFGARTYADGRMSDALTDRVRTACELYRQKYASKLIFSGGPGDGSIHETEAMRAYAMHVGVVPEDIILDRDGLNTRATVENTKSLLAQHRLKSILCVSHFYHLPRVKLTYQRAGIAAYTVPAKESQFLARLPLFMARECAALLKYYFTVPQNSARARRATANSQARTQVIFRFSTAHRSERREFHMSSMGA